MKAPFFQRRTVCAVLLTLAAAVGPCLAPPTLAQYTANFQTNLISGVTSNWSGPYSVGSNTFADALLIQSGGVLSIMAAYNADIWVGYNSSSSNNTVVVSGPGSVLNSSYLTLGYSGAGNSLVINDGGQVMIAVSASVGVTFGSSNNTVLVTDSGSVWTNGGYLEILSGNTLVVSNGAQVVDNNGTVVGGGSPSTGDSNSVLIVGSGSIWNNSGALTVGGDESGPGLTVIEGGRVVSASGLIRTSGIRVIGAGSMWSNQLDLVINGYSSGGSLVISNGGVVIDRDVRMGIDFSSGNNVQVSDGGVWQNGVVYVADRGSNNVIDVAGGMVLATNLVVGVGPAACNNLLEVDSGSVIVTNNGTGVLEVRYGQLIVNGGALQVDTLVITNPCASMVHTAGTITVGSMVLDPNLFRITSIVRQSNDMLITWMMGPGASNTLQSTTGDASGNYNTNGFTDTFVVTNNPYLGTVTNYLDRGAVTNTPVRYYRARLVP